MQVTYTCPARKSSGLDEVTMKVHVSQNCMGSIPKHCSLRLALFVQAVSPGSKLILDRQAAYRVTLAFHVARILVSRPPPCAALLIPERSHVSSYWDRYALFEMVWC